MGGVTHCSTRQPGAAVCCNAWIPDAHMGGYGFGRRRASSGKAYVAVTHLIMHRAVHVRLPLVLIGGAWLMNSL